MRRASLNNRTDKGREAIFKWVTKFILNLIACALLRPVIGVKIPPHALNQCKLPPIITNPLELLVSFKEVNESIVHLWFIYVF